MRDLISSGEASSPSSLPVWRQVGWAAGDTAINFYWGMVNTFLFFFYTDVLGISPHWAGIAFAAATIWDAISDPVMGAVIDRTRTRYGRFRPYILFLSIPCAASFALMFWAPAIEGAWLVAYATATHILFRTFFTGVSIPFTSLAAILSPDSGTRSWMASYRIMFAASGSLIVGFTVPKLLELFTDQRSAFFWSATGLGVVATSILMITFVATRGLDQPAPATSTTPRRAALRAIVEDGKAFWMILVRNRPLSFLFASMMISTILVGMNSKALIYWVKYDLQNIAVLGWLLPLGAAVVISAAPFWARMAQRFSKRTITIAGAALMFVGTGLFYLLNPKDNLTLALVSSIGAFGTAAKFVMYWSMLPDTVEYNALATGSRSDAKIFGFAGFAQKTAVAVNALIFGYLLSATGYVADQPQSVETKQAVLNIMCLVPMAGAVVSSALIWFYPIDAGFHNKMRTQLARREAAQSRSA